MQSIRFRLAAYYSLALTATMVAFGAAVYWERALTAPREAELVLDQHLADRATSVTELLRQQARTSRLTNAPAANSRDSLRTLVDSAHTYFDEMGDEMFIADAAGHVVYVS